MYLPENIAHTLQHEITLGIRDGQVLLNLIRPDAQTVKALHKLKAHISIEEDGQTDFGRIIDDAVLQLLHTKGLTL